MPMNRAAPPRTCVIVNPHAGGEADAEGLATRFGEWEGAVVRTTSGAGDGTRRAREAVDAGFDLVVAAGGDGTIHEVVNGIAPDFDRVRVGVIPLGTGNDFARTAGIPSDATAAVEAIERGEERRVDIVAVDRDGERRYSINACTGGFSGAVGEKASGERKKTWGPLSYLRSALDSVGALVSYAIAFSVDDHPAVEMDVLNLVVANGRYAAHGIPVAPRARLDDGRFDFLVIRDATVPQLAPLLTALVAGEQPAGDGVVSGRGRWAELRSDPEMPFSVDGEVLHASTMRFEVVPAALRLLA